MFQHVQEALTRVTGVAHRTPVMTSQTLNQLVGGEVFLKCENFQRMGAFKFRGAYNAISQLSDAQRRHGVVAYSSGNHGQAVALVSRLLGNAATIVMPSNAPETKRRATAGYGATVVEYDPKTEQREAIAQQIADRDGLTIIPPFDHPQIIAGQGTAALEFVREFSDLDMMLAPCGGGGLLSGTAMATKGVIPRCLVIGVEPETADDAAQSFRTRKLVTISNPQTIADGTRTPSLSDLTLKLILEHVDSMVTVSEDAIREAVRFLFYRMKIVVEPSGALGVAALLSRAVEPSKRIGVILSGGNVDGPTMRSILNS